VALGSIIEDKLANCMSTITEGFKTKISDLRSEVSAIREELETQISDLSAGQAELEERLDKQEKNVTSMLEQQARNLREEFEAQLAALDARSRRAGGGGAGANSTTVKPPKFVGETSWTVFHRQLEAEAVKNNWTPNEKAAHLLSELQRKSADILHTVQTEAKYEDIAGALRDRFGDYQLAAAYRSQLKARVQASGETLKEFAAAVEQLTHRAFVGLPVTFIQTEAAHSFIDGVRDREVKKHLLMGGDWTLNETLNLALNWRQPKRQQGRQQECEG
jgi:DNA repair exonuclease SbcCD ATPase subunit